MAILPKTAKSVLLPFGNFPHVNDHWILWGDHLPMKLQEGNVFTYISVHRVKGLTWPLPILHCTSLYRIPWSCSPGMTPHCRGTPPWPQPPRHETSMYRDLSPGPSPVHFRTTTPLPLSVLTSDGAEARMIGKWVVRILLECFLVPVSIFSTESAEKLWKQIRAHVKKAVPLICNLNTTILLFKFWAKLWTIVNH